MPIFYRESVILTKISSQFWWEHTMLRTEHTHTCHGLSSDSSLYILGTSALLDMHLNVWAKNILRLFISFAWCSTGWISFFSRAQTRYFLLETFITFIKYNFWISFSLIVCAFYVLCKKMLSNLKTLRFFWVVKSFLFDFHYLTCLELVFFCGSQWALFYISLSHMFAFWNNMPLFLHIP